MSAAATCSRRSLPAHAVRVRLARRLARASHITTTPSGHVAGSRFRRPEPFGPRPSGFFVMSNAVMRFPGMQRSDAAHPMDAGCGTESFAWLCGRSVPRRRGTERRKAHLPATVPRQPRFITTESLEYHAFRAWSRPMVRYGTAICPPHHLRTPSLRHGTPATRRWAFGTTAIRQTLTQQARSR